ncbi:NUDIX domain-containing protein [Candidatus Dojkabacteria bacterium]|nr:NUDIX domain-containing protein [Candidatus Dojkabacteria bacterium]
MHPTNTTDELLDLVDQNDNIIGEIFRNKANSCPKYIHREVVIIIINEQGEVLIQKRHKNKKAMPEFWTESVCGHVPKGMSPEAAAQMEMKEELGIVFKPKFLFKKLVNIWTERHFSYVYIGIIPNKTIIKKEIGQVEEIKFVDKNKFDELMESGEKVHGETLMDLERYWNGEYDEKIAKLIV